MASADWEGPDWWGAGVGGKQVLPGQTQSKLKGDGAKKGPLGLLSWVPAGLPLQYPFFYSLFPCLWLVRPKLFWCLPVSLFSFIANTSDIGMPFLRI